MQRRDGTSPAVRLRIVEGIDAGWTGEGVPDRIGLVIDSREFWCGDDFRGMLLVEADADELALLAAAEIELAWLS